MENRELKIPYHFCGEELKYIGHMQDRFMSKWDYAAAALKRGAITKYFANLYEVDPQDDWKSLHAYARHFEEEMWDDKLHEDVVFAKFMFYLNGGRYDTAIIPMDDMDIWNHGKSYQRYPNEKLAEQYKDHYGSRITYTKEYNEAYYLAYMNMQAEQQGLWETYDGKRGVVDATKPVKKEESIYLRGAVNLSKLIWWQDYLEEIGELKD